MKTHGGLLYSPAFLCEGNNHSQLALGTQSEATPFLAVGLWKVTKGRKIGQHRAFYGVMMLTVEFVLLFLLGSNYEWGFWQRHRGDAHFPFSLGSGMAQPQRWAVASLPNHDLCIQSPPPLQLLRLPRCPGTAPHLISGSIQPRFQWF